MIKIQSPVTNKFTKSWNIWIGLLVVGMNFAWLIGILSVWVSVLIKVWDFDISVSTSNGHRSYGQEKEEVTLSFSIRQVLIVTYLWRRSRLWDCCQPRVDSRRWSWWPLGGLAGPCRDRGGGLDPLACWGLASGTLWSWLPRLRWSEPIWRHN